MYFLFCVTEHLRHMACSVIEINICSQDLQEIIIYKTIKKTFTAINKGYFKWGYYHFSCFHAQARTTNMRRATDMKSTPLWISYHFSTCKHSDKLDKKVVWLCSVSYRASCKGHLTVSKQTLGLAGLKFSFSESFFHVETSQFLYNSCLVTAFEEFEDLRWNP